MGAFPVVILSLSQVTDEIQRQLVEFGLSASIMPFEYVVGPLEPVERREDLSPGFQIGPLRFAEASEGAN